MLSSMHSYMFSVEAEMLLLLLLMLMLMMLELVDTLRSKLWLGRIAGC